MATTLSLIASVIAVVGAADTIAKTISEVKVLRDAPDELLALNNEVSDLTVILRNVESCVTGNDAERGTVPPDTLQHMFTLVDRAKSRLLELDRLIHYKLLESGSFNADYKVFWIRWARAKSTVESHRMALRDIRQNIVLQILVISS